MKKHLRICLFSGLTAVLFLAISGLTSRGGKRGAAGKKPPAEPDTHPGEAQPEAASGTGAVTCPAWVGEPNAKTVTTAAKLANTVTGYYDKNGHASFTVENTNALLRYDLTDKGNALITSLSTPSGLPYLTHTGDSYAVLADGSVICASATGGRVNVFDQGFYYYDVHVLDQTFMGPESIGSAVTFTPSDITGLNMMAECPKTSDDFAEFTVTDPADPFFFYDGLSIRADEVDAIQITLRSRLSTEGYLYYAAGAFDSFNNDQKIQFSIKNDGEFHTITIPMETRDDFTGILRGIRFDVGTAKNETVGIRSIQAVSYKKQTPHVSLDRNFVAYSDKINDNTRFLVTKATDGLVTLGTEYRLPKSSVEKLLLLDTSDRQGSAADADSLAAVGFDVKGTGILGFILLDDGTGARLLLSETDSEYVVRQEWDLPERGMKAGEEITFGRRLYTDEAHDFDAFLYEALCERHPLTGVRVLNEETGKTYYAGYNALHGVYEFMVDSGTNFSTLYNDPDHHYPVSFTIEGGDKDRRIYVRSHTTKGWLECAAVLDEEKRMLPIRLEVCKNFAGDGEELFYTHNDSIAYGYTVFPMVVEAGHTEKLTVLHLYERWGQFRLKQLSSIRFFQAYYHQSLGVTETNCICFYSYDGRLPDHRGLSQPYWEDLLFGARDENGQPVGTQTPCNGGPEHENTGTHTFLQYTDANGLRAVTENRAHDIDSSGPVYYDLTMHYITTDGRMTADIRHAEMPQYDENRAYTQLIYEVKEPITIRDFRSDFEIYGISSSKLPKVYTKVGYLDENNQSVIADVNTTPCSVRYTLGSEYPYFDLFKMTDDNPRVFDNSDLYSNVSMLIRDWDIVIGGQPYTGPLMLNDKEHRLSLTLDLGEVTLQPGDHIRMNVILMPWGGYDSRNDDNVRLARENTLVHPILVTSDTDTVLTADPWIPRVRSVNGQSAIFTIFGGCDNLGDRKGTASEGQTKFRTYYDRDFNAAVRVYGFRSFGRACVCELIDGAWVPVTLASANGYDGYSILYDEDNTFSIAFAVCMNEAKPRTFRVITD